MSLQSVRNPRFANLTDAQAIEHARAAQRLVKDQRAHMDKCDLWEDEVALKFLEMFEARVHALDEELCARDLDWPKD